MPLVQNTLPATAYVIERISGKNPVILEAHYAGEVRCPCCDSARLRKKDRFVRKLRHESLGARRCMLHLTGYKYHCQECGRYFHQRFPGILPYKRSTEGFRREVFEKHFDGICQSRLAQRLRMGQATVERWFHEFLERKMAEMKNNPCPRELGIDEHYFTRKKGYATTLCDLEHHRVYDVTLGRSVQALEAYFQRLKEPERVELVCMDMAETYRSLVRRYLPRARIVADRFHVIKLVNHHFLATWRELDPVGSKNRGLLSLMRRHRCNLSAEQYQRLQDYFQEQMPALGPIWSFKQKLCELLLIKTRTKRQCRRLIPRLIEAFEALKASGFDSLKTLGESLERWQDEIVCMWRFSKNNGITEGFHNKMETINRRAYGFKNFENYRLRVKVMCS